MLTSLSCACGSHLFPLYTFLFLSLPSSQTEELKNMGINRIQFAIPTLARRSTASLRFKQIVHSSYKALTGTGLKST